MKRIIIALSLVFVSLCQIASGREYVDRIFMSSLGQSLPYKVIFPENFNPAKSYPMLLFLHGSGERGVDNVSQIAHGGERLLTDAALRNVIVIAPQCPKEDYWVNIIRPVDNASRTFPKNAPISVSLSAVKELIDSFISLGFVDTEHVYGSGLSMGAFGILDLTARYPDLFAAVEPICGGIDSSRLESFSGRTAFRFFHGLKDDVVLPKFSQQANMVLRSNGVESTIIEYPDANHNSWDSAFAEPDFIDWLLKH